MYKKKGTQQNCNTEYTTYQTTISDSGNRFIVTIFPKQSVALQINISCNSKVDPLSPEEVAKQYFHREHYCHRQWMPCGTHEHCRLCKTQHSAPKSKHKHWAKGLCRGCYRRLSTAHRKYNDFWNKQRSNATKRKSKYRKKRYKYIDPARVQFAWADIDTLLERYDWRCAYSGIRLQGYDHKRPNAFFLEYELRPDGSIELVPVSRSISCSKKNTQQKLKLKKWAKKKNIEYPFSFVPAPSDNSKGYYRPDSTGIYDFFGLDEKLKEGVIQ